MFSGPQSDELGHSRARFILKLPSKLNGLSVLASLGLVFA